MARKNWNKVADKEFRGMDKQAQEQWAELRRRLHV
jgi:hypothetical protein